MLSEYKLTLPAHSIDSAPSGARALLEQAKSQMGFVPNLYARMANSPGVLETYLHGYALFRQASGFTAAEQEVVFLSISVENGCEYCVAAHSLVADVMSKVPVEVTNAIRNGDPVPDARLATLSGFVRTMVSKRGLPGSNDIEAFLSAGYTERQVLEVILAIALKTLSNYTNHNFHTPVDTAFASRAWLDSRS